MVICGIDYSMTSPCICLCNDDSNMSFENCKVYYLTDTVKYSGNFKNMNGVLFEKPDVQIERFDKISNWALDIISASDLVILEDYSMGSKGAVFHIAENTALLKYKMYKKGIKYKTVPPTVLKKFATGKGNSDKEVMYSSFIKETKCNIKNVLGYKSKNTGNPISDIVDSYYLLKYSKTIIGA